MPPFRTTNLRFPAATYEELRRRAAGRGRPMAELVREAVAVYLGRETEAEPLALGADPADRWIGSIPGGASDESTEHDHYLYDLPKEGAPETPRRHRRAARPVPRRGPAPRRRG